MKRITKSRYGAIVGAAALALSATAVAQAQQGQPAQQAQPQPAPTQAEIAASPAVKRLKELLEVVNGGDASVMLAYAQANAVEPTKKPPGPAALPLAGAVMDLHRRSLGLDLVRLISLEQDGAVALVRNKLTGDEQGLAIKVETAAPHRITALPPVSSALIAPFARAPAPGQSQEAKLQQIGSYLKRLGEKDVFSGVVVIARDGKPVFSQAYGYADRDKKVLNKVDTIFGLGSMNKLFTGLAIGQLVEQGKLSYEDPLSKFLPTIPDPETAKRIKIKHLLSHTSGISGVPNPNPPKAVDGPLSVGAVLEFVAWEPLKFDPGTKWAYSNHNFGLLGRVIEIASGEDYFDYMQKNVFAPANMTHTFFPARDQTAVAIAQPYEIEFDGTGLHYVNKYPTFPPQGGPAGGGVSSAPDIINLANALHAGRIVKPETFRLHSSPKTELNAPTYGYGFSTSARMAKRPLVGHGGNTQGGCTEFGALTDTPYTVVVLSNLTINTCLQVAGKLLQVLTPQEGG